MASLIRNGKIAIDSWRLHNTADTLEAAWRGTPPSTLGALVALPLWLDWRARLKSAPLRLGVSLQGHDDPACIVSDLASIGLIAVHIERFTDGRAYSLARLLRGRYSYRGELRAVGDVLHDQLYYLTRVGFDAFRLREGQDARAAVTALKAFSVAYQAAADDSLPLFRRRRAYA